MSSAHSWFIIIVLAAVLPLLGQIEVFAAPFVLIVGARAALSLTGMYETPSLVDTRR